MTNALNSSGYFEWLGGKGDDKNKILYHLQRHLDNVIVGDGLIIIDPYFFAPTKDVDYENFVIELVQKYLNKLLSLTFITNSFKVDLLLRSRIYSGIQSVNSSIQLFHSQSDIFHDRFWLSKPRNRGMFMGTSLNGIGKKYCLVDYIDFTDTDAINQVLTDHNLISTV